MAKTRILFVCLGNICRSPTAHGVMDAMIKAEGREHEIEIDSAGTGDWHIGEQPDRRTQATAAKRGYNLENLRARQVSAEDYNTFDFLLAMDRSNLNDLKAMRPTGSNAKIYLFLKLGEVVEAEDVPDPYYGGSDGFEHVLDLVETACSNILKKL